ncbi:MAG TPA: hypothetical protein VD963_10985 [Phycisphaerales bacterium]|nr:hypothetical protein [Phycisphaerales bacterium]
MDHRPDQPLTPAQAKLRLLAWAEEPAGTTGPRAVPGPVAALGMGLGPMALLTPLLRAQLVPVILGAVGAGLILSRMRIVRRAGLGLILGRLVLSRVLPLAITTVARRMMARG